MEPTKEQVVTIPCSYCGVKKDEVCINIWGKECEPHRSRVIRVRRALVKAKAEE